MTRQDRIVFYKMFRYLCLMLWAILQRWDGGEAPPHVQESWELLEPQFAAWRDQG